MTDTTTAPRLLSDEQMASFVARGFLRFDAVAPADVNEQFMAEAGEPPAPTPGLHPRLAHRSLMAAAAIPEVAPGVRLDAAYPEGSATRRLLDLPVVRGAIQSLLGQDPVFDHHFLHVTYPPSYYEIGAGENLSQPTHQDSTIDPRLAFDVQLMYYPHVVTWEMGGTRFIPGTHLRKVSEAALGRYQNIRGQQHMVCDAGTLLFLHHGIWHGGGVNRSRAPRTMLKIRLHASGTQKRQWNISPRSSPEPGRAIFHVKQAPSRDSVATILTTPEPWFEQDTGRLEIINRIKLWRYLTDDPAYDADYWLTRLEHAPTAFA